MGSQALAAPSGPELQPPLCPEEGAANRALGRLGVALRVAWWQGEPLGGRDGISSQGLTFVSIIGNLAQVNEVGADGHIVDLV